MPPQLANSPAHVLETQPAEVDSKSAVGMRSVWLETLLIAPAAVGSDWL
jgi:hypothetical protein